MPESLSLSLLHPQKAETNINALLIKNILFFFIIILFIKERGTVSSALS